MVGPDDGFERPDFDGLQRFWTGLLQSRGLPTSFRWVFYEDYARLKSGFAFHLRPREEADRIARFAYRVLDPANPAIDSRFAMAIVAYAVVNGEVITGFQGDQFNASDDIFRKDWNIYFDARDNLVDDCMVVSDEMAWERIRAEQPLYLSELDYCVSVEKLRTKFGYTD